MLIVASVVSLMAPATGLWIAVARPLAGASVKADVLENASIAANCEITASGDGEITNGLIFRLTRSQSAWADGGSATRSSKIISASPLASRCLPLTSARDHAVGIRTGQSSLLGWLQPQDHLRLSFADPLSTGGPSVAFSPDGQYLAAADANRPCLPVACHIFRFADGHPSLTTVSSLERAFGPSDLAEPVVQRLDEEGRCGNLFRRETAGVS